MLLRHSRFVEDRFFDSTIAFLREGYSFGLNRFGRLDTDVFEVRLLLRRTIVMRGTEAAELFYDEERFVRRRAMPRRALRSFLGSRAVQTLDGVRHRHRKAMFMSLMHPSSIADLDDIVSRELRRAALEWERRRELEFMHEIGVVLCRSACQWGGVTLGDDEVERRTRQFE